MSSSMCRAGIFYDGTFVTHAQNFFWGQGQGWLQYQAFHGLVEQFIRKQEQNFSSHKVVYASWHQGLFSVTKANEKQLKDDRRRHFDLAYAGIETKLIPMSQMKGEKGVDVAITINALEVGLDGKIDVAVLVTGDGDFVPLARTLMKHGVRTAIVYFEYEQTYKGQRYKSFANHRLLEACNYSLNINGLKNDKEYRAMFKGLFRQPDKT